ncbi:radical SAM protein [bacterium]|nr:radical SAM protein [bacterium]
MKPFIPAYMEMDPDELQARVEQLEQLASPCTLCPRKCGSNRKEGERGYCRTGYLPVVSSVQPHHGEEKPLSGIRGSGTIFLTNCNLGCTFCQNYDISHLGRGQIISVPELASAMLTLQQSGCHNINFVTPSHQIHTIVKAVSLAAQEGLRLPLVYNTGGYDSIETLRLLEGIFDIYMPDLKFTDSSTAATLADADDYPEVIGKAVGEMYRQVGDLCTDEKGIAHRGLLVRHLVLPGDLAGSQEAFRFLAEEISTNTYLNVMAQYRPCHEAVGQPVIGDPLQQSDYLNALELARKWGLRRLD